MVERPSARNAHTNRKTMPQPVIPDVPHHSLRSREPMYVILVTGIVIGLIILGLSISVSAVAEKIRMARSYGVILDIADKGRHAAEADHLMGVSGRQDLLAVLERLGQITPAGEVDGLKFLHNPWGGTLTAVASPDNTVRVETIMPPHTCQRFVGFLYAQNLQVLGIRMIEVKNIQGAWRQAYAQNTQIVPATDHDIANMCIGGGDQTDVALTFTLRQGN